MISNNYQHSSSEKEENLTSSSSLSKSGNNNNSSNNDNDNDNIARPSPSSVTNTGIEFPDIHLPSPPRRGKSSNNRFDSSSQDGFPDLIEPSTKQEEKASHDSISSSLENNTTLNHGHNEDNKKKKTNSSTNVIISKIKQKSDNLITNTLEPSSVFMREEPDGKKESFEENVVSSKSTSSASKSMSFPHVNLDEEHIATGISTDPPEDGINIEEASVETSLAAIITPPVEQEIFATANDTKFTGSNDDHKQEHDKEEEYDGNDGGSAEEGTKKEEMTEQERKDDITSDGYNEGTPTKLSASTGPLPSSLLLSKQVKPGISKRSDFPLIPSKVALLIIDIQDHLSKPTPASLSDSYLYKEALPRTISNIERLLHIIRHYRDQGSSRNSGGGANGCEVIFTYLEALTKDCRDVSLDYKLSGPNLSTLPGPHNPATFLDQVCPSTTQGKGDILIPKTSCSVFCSTNIHYVLQNLHIEQLVICGQLTDQCVESAVRDAADLGYFVTVAEDACAAQSQSSHEKGLHGMKGFARIIPTHQIIEELQTAPAVSSSLTTTTTRARATLIPQQESNPDLWTLVPSTESSTRQVTNSASNVQSHAVVTNGNGNVNNINISNSHVSTEPSTAASTQVAAPSETAVLPCNIGIMPTCDWNATSNNNDNKLVIPLLRTLQYAGVKFVRYLSVDICNSIRCKVVPLDHLLRQRRRDDDDSGSVTLDHAVSLATVVVAGLSTLGDFMIEDSDLDARGVLDIQPDLSTLRVLPYAKKTALVIGTAHDQYSGELSEFCPRGLLSRVLQTAEKDHGIQFSVGAEIEFCLHSQSTDLPVDDSVFANTTTLNQQEEFISELYDQLQQQNIDVELLHAESAPGQFELVLQYQEDPIQLADNVVLARETISAVARAHQMKALFLPKIHQSKAGNGLHVHLSIRDKKNRLKNNAFPHPSLQGEISLKGQHFIEGILAHLPGLTALTVPSHNSYRRIGVGCWTGSSVVWGIEDKEAPLRVCAVLGSRTQSNVELKLVDSTANIYLALAGILSAGLDGIAQQLPLRPMHTPSRENAGSPTKQEQEPLPSTFQDSLNCLEEDSFLVNNVLGLKLSKAYLALRRAEAEASVNMTLEDEVQNALQKA